MESTRPQTEPPGPLDGAVVKLRRGEVQDNVVAELRRGLMVGSFVPGQIMSLRKLAAGLGTSPMPIREALTQLVAANALEEMPNRSVRVPRLNKERLQELFDVREVVEVFAAKGAFRKATPLLRDKLAGINIDLLQAITRRDILSCLAANQAFHFTLYEAAESEVLMPLIESLWLQCGPTMYFSLLVPDMPWDASAHAEVLEALRLGDATMGQRAIARDIRSTARALLKCATFQRPSGLFASPLGDFNFDK